MYYIPPLTEIPTEIEITIPIDGDSLVDVPLHLLNQFYTIEIKHRATGQNYSLAFDVYEKNKNNIVVNLHFDETPYTGQYDFKFISIYTHYTLFNALLEIQQAQQAMPEYSPTENILSYSDITEITVYNSETTLNQYE